MKATCATSGWRQKFPLVIIPFRPLQHMYTVQDQVAALTTAAFHVAEGGSLAFDVFFPNFEGIAANIGKEILDLEWTVDSERRKMVRRYFRKKSYDKVQQTFSGEFVFRTYEGDNLILEETGPLKMSYYTYQQLRALFLLSGTGGGGGVWFVCAGRRLIMRRSK